MGLDQILRQVEKGRNFLLCFRGLGSGSLHESVENKGKEVEAYPGLVPFTKGPSFVELLKVGSAAIVGDLFLGERLRRWNSVILTFYRR